MKFTILAISQFSKKIIVIITGKKGQKTGFVLLLIRMWVTQISETPINTMSNSFHEKLRYVHSKIQQTKILVTCQRFGDFFLFGLVWQYSSIQKNIIKVGSKSWILTCS